MKLSELIQLLQDIEKDHGDIFIDIGMDDYMTSLLISKIKRDGSINVIEPIKIIHCD